MINYWAIIFGFVLYLGVIPPIWSIENLDTVLKKGGTQKSLTDYSFGLSSLYVGQNQNISMETKKDFNGFKGFVLEGQNLNNYCGGDKGVKFSHNWKLEQLKVSVLKTLQFIGLELSSKAIGKYAQKLNFSEQEFSNLKDRLVNNYCSKDIAIFDSSELLKFLNAGFNLKSDSILPTVIGNPYFSDDLEKLTSVSDAQEKELIYTVKLFRSLCSWGYDTYNLRLLAPIASNPYIMGHVFRNLQNKELALSELGEIKLEEAKNSTQIFCEDFKCYKLDPEDYLTRMTKYVGINQFDNALNRLYCGHFKDTEYLYLNQNSTIKKWINEQTIEDSNLIAGQFIALITKVPNFILRIDSFKDFDKIARAGVDRTWGNWAKRQLSNVDQGIYYEEPLTVEKIPREKYFNKNMPNFKVIFDINFGELDRNTQIVGKLKTHFTFKLYKKYLKWIRSEWLTINHADRKKVNHLIKNFKLQMKDGIEKFKKKQIITPWKGDIERLIAKELLSQLELYKGSFFKKIIDKKEKVKIDIQLNYSPFALKYIHEKYRSQKNL